MQCRNRCLPWLLALACLVLSACRVPISEHPLTSEMPTPVDERLVGTWKVDTSQFSDGGEKVRTTYVVRRLKDDPLRLEIVRVQDGEEQTAEATKLVTCHFAMHDYFSLGPIDKNENVAYAICHYRFDDADRCNVYLLDADFMIDAIDRRLVAGDVNRNGGQVTGIAIRAKPEELRRFLHKHAPECFAMKTPLAARRVK